MNKIQRHIPNFMEGFDDVVVAEFKGLDELLEIPFVKRWREVAGNEKFYRYSQDGSGNPEIDPRTYLMAEINNGRNWYVIGFMDNPVDGLPKWEPKERNDKEN